MKSKILLCALFMIASYGSAFAQTDSTSESKTKKYATGVAVYAEFGVLSNNSFSNIRKSLKAQNVEPFGSLMGSVVLAKRMESRSWIAENRFIIMNTTKPNHDTDVRRASLWGLGLGMSLGRKIVDSQKWNVYIPVGFDAMVYKLGIKSNSSASLAQLLLTPSNYQAIKLYSASLNLNAGVGVDYKTGFMPESFEKFYISAKASYHLPIASSGQWRGENVQVNDLARFKPNQLFLSIGVAMTPKFPHNKWGGMH